MANRDQARMAEHFASFDAFIKAAWDDHGERAQAVADRLASSVPLIESADEIAAFAKLATHVYGEHLGHWDEGVALLESLRMHPAWDESPAVTGPVATGIAVLRHATGDTGPLEQLLLEDRIAALATVTAAFAGRREFGPAIAALSSALELAGRGLPSGSPAHRALAVGGNNLAAALEEKPDRDESEKKGMVAAAEAGLQYWKLAGGWLEEERAEYRLTRSLLQAGDAAKAVQTASRCIDVCAKNEAPPFEQFFGHAVLALAQRRAGDQTAFAESRRQALDFYNQVPPGERQWCETDLKELGG